MKSVSVKKIATVVAGAAMLGAAFAGAATVDPAVGNFKFFQNGEPKFKIVVGARAAASDYWNAAKLAELFGNLAYSDKAVTADTSALSCGGAAGAAGTCSVTGKGVTLEFTSPAGATGQTGSITVKTQLYDYLDVSQVTATTTRANAASTIIGDGVNTGGYLVSASLYPDVAYKGLVDLGTGSYSVSEEEAYYFTGKSYYDTSQKKYLGDNANAVYTINFTDQIPYHVDVNNGSVTGRPSNDAYITENRNVKIKFLGGDYVITDFENSTTNAISLGSQAISIQMKVGQEIQLGDKKVKLVQISPIATTTATLPPAYFEVYDAAGTRLDYFSMNKDTSNYNKNGVILDVRDVFVGGGDTSYAEIAAYSSAITLTNGQKISFEGDDTATKLNDDATWTASLQFTTKSVQGVAVKALKQIKLSKSTSSNKLSAGDGFNLIEKPVSKKLTFVGVEPVDTDTIRVFATGTNRYSITPNADAGVPGGSQVDLNVTTVKSGYASAFQVNGVNVDTLLIDSFNGVIFYKDPNSANYTNVGTESNSLNYYYPSTTAADAIQLVANMTKTFSNTPTVATNATACVAGMNAVNTSDVIMVYAIDTAGNWIKASNVTGVATNALTFTAQTGASTYSVYVRDVATNGDGKYYPAYSQDGNTTLVGISGVLTGTKLCKPAGTIAAVALPAESSTLKVRIKEAVTENTATLNGYYDVALFKADPSYLFNSSTTGTLTETYTSSATGITTIVGALGGGSFEQGFIDPAGGVLSLVSLSEVNVKYPKSLAKAVWTFGVPSTVNVTAGGASVTSKTLAEAESYNLGGGYSVKVLSVAGQASCTGGTAGAGGSVSGTATCNPKAAAVVNPLDPSSDPLVVMDSASGIGPAVVVGGPVVNTIAANTPGAATIASAAGQSGVRVVGDKIFAYGFTAADTTDAVDSLIKWVAGQRDTVRGV